jgi:hypothetical protein
MVRGGAIEGRILDAGGNPVSSATVTARKVAYRGGMRSLGIVATARSDESGRYRLFWLGAGEYYVHAEDRRSDPRADTGTYYPNSSEFETATPLLLQPDSELTTVDVQIRRSTVVPVTVRVIDDQGNPKRASLSFIPLDRVAPLGTMSVSVVISTTPQRPPGPQVVSVRPGTYDLMGRGENLNVIETGRTSVKVGSSPAEVTLVVRPAIDVNARVVTRNATTDPKEMQFQLEGRDGTPTRMNAVPGFNPAGTFRFQMPVGRHLPRIYGLRGEDYVADIRQDGRSVFNDGLITVTDRPVSLEWEVRGDGGRVQGTVQGAPATRVRSARVLLVPDAPRRANPLLYHGANPDDRGSFEFHGVAPGNYRLFAWENVPEGAWENAEFLALYERYGRAVSVNAGIAANASVDWIPASAAPLSSIPPPVAPAITGMNSNGHTIEGRVTSAADGKPISRAIVNLFPQPTQRTTTDQDGKFVLTGVPDGRFDVSVQHEAFVGSFTNGRYSPTSTQRVNLDAKNPSPSLAFTLSPAGVLSGRILGPGGEPVGKVRVEILSSIPQVGRIVDTDDRGEFRVIGLSPDRYLIAAEFRGLGPSPPPQATPVRTYYPGTIDSSRAVPVGVNLGSDIRDVSFQIQTTPTVSIFGKITTDLTGVVFPARLRVILPAMAISNALDPANPNTVIPGTVNQTTGEFEIKGLQPGSYTVLSLIRGGSIPIAGVAVVQVGTQPVRNVQIHVRRGMDVRVEVTGGSKSAAITRQIELVPRLRQADLTSRTSGSANSSYFTLPNVFQGSYDIVHNVIAGECIRDVRQRGQSVLQSGVTIGPDSADPIELILESTRQAIPQVPGQRGMPRCL